MPTVLAPAPPAVRYTEQEYLLRERDALEKSDFLNGEIITMAGSSFAHSQISHNLTLFLAGQLRKVGCQTAGPDLRIRVMADEKQLFTYPDFVVICGKPEFAPDEFHNLINPKAIIEILSPSTQAYDRTTKAEMYRSIPTLQELAFIAQDRFFVEHLIRQNNNAWLLNDYTQVENSFLFAGCEITLAQIYELVEF